MTQPSRLRRFLLVAVSVGLVAFVFDTGQVRVAASHGTFTLSAGIYRIP